MPACHHEEVSNHGLANIIIIIIIIIRIASLLSPVGMCQYKGKVEEPPTTVALRRPLIFGASPDLLLILVSLRFATRMMKTTHGGLGTNVAEAF